MKTKQFIIIAALLLAAIAPMKAQDWKREIVNGDELLNTKDKEVFIYITKEYKCCIITDPYAVIVDSPSSVFDVTGNGYAALVGFYDSSDKLIKKAVVTAFVGDGFHTFSFFDSNGLFGTHDVEDIFKWLNGGKGYVRISAKRYDDDRINVILPTMKNNVQ